MRKWLLILLCGACDPGNVWPCGFGPCDQADDGQAHDTDSEIFDVGEWENGCEMIVFNRGGGLLSERGWLDPIDDEAAVMVVASPDLDISFVQQSAAWGMLGLESGDIAWLWNGDLPVYAPDSATGEIGWIAVPVDSASGWRLEYATLSYEVASRDFVTEFTVGGSVAVLTLEIPDNLGGLLVYRESGTAKVAGVVNDQGHHAAAIPVADNVAGPQPVLYGSVGWVPMGGTCQLTQGASG